MKVVKQKKKTYFEPKAYALGKKCGKQEPDSNYIEFFDLTDPGHRLGNFGKELKKLAAAPKSISNLMDEQAVRLIKIFKYLYKQALIKEFEEIKRTRFVALNHMCGDHTTCSDEWCYKMKSDLEDT